MVIQADTQQLRSYADRLDRVNSRLNRLDGQMNRLYLSVGLVGLFQLLQADALTGWNNPTSPTLRYSLFICPSSLFRRLLTRSRRSA